MKSSAARNFRRKLRRWFYLENTPRPVRRVIIGVIGGTILLLGVAMIILPGPAIVVIPLGLAVLATEYIWARRWLKNARRLMEEARKKVSKTQVEPVASASKVSSEAKTLTLK